MSKANLLKMIEEERARMAKTAPAGPAPSAPVAPKPKASVTPVKVNRYDDIKDVTLSLGHKLLVWEDRHLANIKIYEVEPLATADAIIQGRALVEDINSERITSSTVMRMLSLAVSLRSTSDPEEALLISPNQVSQDKIPMGTFDTVAREMSEEEREILNMMNASTRNAAASTVNQRLNTQDADSETESSDERYQAAAYAYLAAYLMRLYCRQVNNIQSNYAKVITRYKSFYDSGVEVLETVIPSVVSFSEMREILARKPELTNTWVLWLAKTENEKNLIRQDRGLLEYLGIQVFAYLGMHAVTQIMAINQKGKINMAELLQLLESPLTRVAVREVYRIIKEYEITDRHPKRTTYFRYARVWNPGYFMSVQSKQCPHLVYLAAKTMKELSTSGGSDPTEIYAIKDMSQSMKDRLNVVSDKLVTIIMDMSRDDETGRIWMN